MTCLKAVTILLLPTEERGSWDSVQYAAIYIREYIYTMVYRGLYMRTTVIKLPD